MSRAALCVALLAAAGPTQVSAAGPWQASEWRFAATLDGSPIGTHRFRLQPIAGSDDAWQLESEASYDVKLLGIVVYRYRHHALERWESGCLAALSSDTDDNGVARKVVAQRIDDRLQVTVSGAEKRVERVSGCVMSFAYWNPDIRHQSRLLNPQSGRLEQVSVTGPRQATLVQGGRDATATAWRIQAESGPIDVWTDATDRWFALDAQVSGKRQLSYRLP